jgi:uncharacterized protein YgbK (DUF1537 family)
MTARINKREFFASLPPVWPEELLPRIRAEVARTHRKVVVLDDDPTGTQTVRDIPVLTTWSPEELAREFANERPCFYILTNTRAFPVAEAVQINQEIACNLMKAVQSLPGRSDFVVVSRGDSTLRGHFPAETDALGKVLWGGGRMPPVLLVPYFEAGGRYTVDDVHFVAEGGELIPAAETPFARDAVFGYRNSNLRAWVEEKTGGAVRATDVKSISIDDLRVAGPDAVKAKLLALRHGEVCIANAAAPRDLEVLAWAALQTENAGSHLMYRTAASFVAARIGLPPDTLWQPSLSRLFALVPTDAKGNNARGGLIIVGSYVLKTTMQLEMLVGDDLVHPVEISVAAIMSPAQRGPELARVARQTNAALQAGRDVAVFTSRRLVTGDNAETSLAIGKQVSAALVELLQRIETRPRYLIAKGGVTSSDLATQGLGVKRAIVLGQILPGVPVWELGPETKYPGMPYVVFPGNVGEPNALREVVRKFQMAFNQATASLKNAG